MVATATMTFEEYKNIEHPVPYVLQLQSESAELIYYGANHMYNPADPMFDDIELRFKGFHPDFALVEGGVIGTLLPRDEIIRQEGERGFLCLLCSLHSVPVADLEPSFDEEVRHLFKTFTKEQLLLFYCLRQIVQYHYMEAQPPYKEYMSNFARWIASKLLLELPLAPLEFLSAQYRQVFGCDLDWQTLSDDVVNPLIQGGLTNEISRQSGYFRDASHVSNVIRAVKKHRKVFAIAGASHVVMQERALRAALKNCA